MKLLINPTTTARSRYWDKTRRFTGILSFIWLVTTFGVIYFARELSHMTLFGWPLSYYMAAQGATLLYVVIVGCYAWQMARLDRRYDRESQHGE
jgi:putative solute:sodium symporter small subunit